MMVNNELTLYDEITVIAEDYFGPAAPRFISRMMANHLHKKSSQLTADDLPELIMWIKLTMAMVTEDSATVTKFISRISRLSKAC